MGKDRITVGKDFVVKHCMGETLYQNEVEILEYLRDCPFTPNIISKDDFELTITFPYHGEPYKKKTNLYDILYEEYGIEHFDQNLENVLQDAKGNLVVVDFEYSFNHNTNRGVPMGVKFKSKKLNGVGVIKQGNKSIVERVDAGTVSKTFIKKEAKERYQNEVEILEFLKDCPFTPNIISKDDNNLTILLPYLGEPYKKETNLCDVLYKEYGVEHMNQGSKNLLKDIQGNFFIIDFEYSYNHILKKGLLTDLQRMGY